MDKRWSLARKKILLESRVGVTNELVDLIEKMENKPTCLVSASAVGYYGFNQSQEPLSESAHAGNGFAADLCSQWEQAAKRVETLGVRTCIVRIGLVLHSSGGVLKKLLPCFPLWAGRVIRQWKTSYAMGSHG